MKPTVKAFEDHVEIECAGWPLSPLQIGPPLAIEIRNDKGKRVKLRGKNAAELIRLLADLDQFDWDALALVVHRKESKEEEK